MKSAKVILLVAAIVVALLLEPLFGKVFARAAGSFTVTNTNDSGTGSLRQAITNANVAGGGTIDATAISGTIDLLTELPSLDSNLTLNGPGADALTVQRSIASQSAFGIFTINLSRVVIINGLTIKNGVAPTGGGIANSGTLTVNNLVIANNTANGNGGGGIYNQGGTLIVNQSTIANNSATPIVGGGFGGGIFSFNGTISISDSTVVDNSSSTGGGVGSLFAVVTVSDTIIDHNFASGFGGGILADDSKLTVIDTTIANNSTTNTFVNGGGAGIAIRDSSSVVTNSTIANNAAPNGFGGGGGILNGVESTLTISNSTVANNSTSGLGVGGGIANQGTLHLQSTIVAKNIGDAPDIAGTIISAGNNLIGDTKGNSGSDISKGDLLDVDPLFQPDEAGKPTLQKNGGRRKTIALLPTSPAIDKGKNALALTTDQRGSGYSRTLDNPFVANATGDGTDIGAYELQILVINGVSKNGKDLSVSGIGFVEGAKIFVDGEKVKTLYESANSLIGKKAAKGLAPGAKIKVRNPDGTTSNEWTLQ